MNSQQILLKILHGHIQQLAEMFYNIENTHHDHACRINRHLYTRNLKTKQYMTFQDLAI